MDEIQLLLKKMIQEYFFNPNLKEDPTYNQESILHFLASLGFKDCGVDTLKQIVNGEKDFYLKKVQNQVKRKEDEKRLRRNLHRPKNTDLSFKSIRHLTIYYLLNSHQESFPKKDLEDLKKIIYESLKRLGYPNMPLSDEFLKKLVTWEELPSKREIYHSIRKEKERKLLQAYFSAHENMDLFRMAFQEYYDFCLDVYRLTDQEKLSLVKERLERKGI